MYSRIRVDTQTEYGRSRNSADRLSNSIIRKRSITMCNMINRKFYRFRAEILGRNLAKGLLDEKEHRIALKDSANRASYLATLNKLIDTDLNDLGLVSDFLTETWPDLHVDMNNEELLIEADIFAKWISA